MAIVNKLVKATGGDFTSISAALTDFNANFVNGDIWTIATDKTFQDETLNFGTLNTTMTSGSLTIKANDSSFKPRIKTTSGTGINFGANIGDIILRDLIWVKDTPQISIQFAGDNLTVENNQILPIRDTVSFSMTAGTTIFRNCYFQGGELFGVLQTGGTGIMKAHRCTFNKTFGDSSTANMIFLQTSGNEILGCRFEQTSSSGFVGAFMIKLANAAATTITMDFNSFGQDGIADYIDHNGTTFATPQLLNASFPALEANAPQTWNIEIVNSGPSQFVTDIGTSISGITNDYDGSAIPQPPGGTEDIGIFERIPIAALVDTDPPVFAGGVSGITATDAAASNEVDLTWNAATDVGEGMEGYSIYHSTASGTVFSDGIKIIVPFGTNSVTIGNLTNGVVRHFGVRARDKAIIANETTNTDTVSATPTGVVGDTDIPAWDTTIGVQTLTKTANFFLTASWNTATDAISSVSYNIYLREGSDPDSFGPGSVFFAFNTENLTVNLFTKVDGVTNIDFTKANHVIVRAVDEAGNEETNVVSLNVPAIVEATPSLDIANAIRNRFRTSVIDIISGGLPTQFDNAPFTRPTTGLWCRFRVGLENQNQVSLGSSNRFRYRGEAVAKLFGPLGKGDKDLLTAADFIENRFKALSISGIVFRTPRVVPMGRDGKSWRLDVICPFQADNIV